MAYDVGKNVGLPLRINYTGASFVQSEACYPCLARPHRRHRAGVSRAFWASWCSTPPRLDLAGQWKHLAVKEQKQQRMDRGGGPSNGDFISHLNPAD